MPITQRFFIHFIIAVTIFSSIIYILFRYNYQQTTSIYTTINADYRRRPECSCIRPELLPLLSNLTTNSAETSSLHCSQYANRRGPNQRIISVSLFGPKENKMFQFNRSLNFLNELINDMNKVYSDGFTLRVYHDNTINTTDIVCPIECQNPNVDFCNMNSKLFIPPKIWRFIPAGDPLVDIMMSRDLDSALTQRERSAVNAWLASNKSFHAMRDHPMHGVPMLGGMWGFRPSLNANLSRIIYNKIHREDLIKNYGGRNDQTFLANEIWPHAKSSIIVHDSFLCKSNFGQQPLPFPTQRPSFNETNCFIGCVRPCCGFGRPPFGECPKDCRPKDHPEWVYC
ncbi:unnamed protein product [Adineta steineri]|uniref:Uncharacterized protein n=1 Tax=Adineta steineri TaxID=433720 RepID=A0A814UHJ8_9BILA|nr:unnamed protein product [Adineta steineri]CAF1175794.1 unnamed protein product [Adineta steineri]